jgi:hypothetical protein
MDTVRTPDPLVELGLGLLFLVLIIIVHGIAIRFINRRFSSAWVRVTSSDHTYWKVNTVLTLTIAALALVHLAETLIWSLPIYGLSMLPTMRDTYFFVLESYTTLGAGSVSLPEKWRLIGPMIGMSGLFTFGWTGSVLVNIMTDFARLDRSVATKEQREKADAAEDAGTAR